MKKTLLLLFAACSLFAQDKIYLGIGCCKLYTREASHCALTYIGQAPIIMLDIALTPNGRLWATDSASKLYEINPLNAQSTLVGQVGSFDFFNSLEALDNDTLLFEKNQYLYGLNVNDASYYQIGYIGFVASGDLAWFDNDLYLTTENQLIRIVLNADHSAILNVTAVNDIEHPIPRCYGLSAGEHNSFDDNILLGFSEWGTFQICHIDGTYTQRCGIQNSNGFNGAASYRLETQDPLPTVCPQQLGTSNFDQEKDLSLFPNPVGANQNLSLKLQNITSQNLSIRIVNLQGVVLYAENGILPIDDLYTINIANIGLTGGVYAIEILDGNSRSNALFVVK